MIFCRIFMIFIVFCRLFSHFAGFLHEDFHGFCGAPNRVMIAELASQAPQF